MQKFKVSSWAIGLSCLTLVYSQSGMADTGSNSAESDSKTKVLLSSNPSVAGTPLAIMGQRKAPVAAAPAGTAGASNTVDPNSDGMTEFYKPYNPNVDVTPSARGCSQSAGPFFTGSFIYWKSKFDVYNTAITSNTLDTDTVNGDLKLQIKDPKTRFSPGFKVGAGYNFKRDIWDMYFNWTWLQSNNHNSISSSNQAILPLLIITSIGGSSPDEVGLMKMGWRFHFNTVDWELGRNFFIGRNLSVRPLVGAKAGWIHTRVDMDIRDVMNKGDIASSSDTSVSNHNWGIGPRFGINTRWVLSHCNIGFVANVAGSLLWEDVKSKLTFNFVNTPGFVNTKPNFTGATLKLKDHLLVPVVETYLGLDWGSCFSKKRFYFSVSAGFEMQYWVNQQQIGTVLETNPNNDINLYGLTASARIDF